jgi:hypothetical protein
MAFMNPWIIERVSKDKRLWFGDEMGRFDPRRQSEDLGNDAIKAGDYGIRNLQLVMSKLPEWTKVPNSDYQNLSFLRKVVIGQYIRYLYHATMIVGGRMETTRTTEESGVQLEYVPRDKQKRAVEFLDRQLFNTPAWVLDKKIIDQTGGGFTEIWQIQKGILSRLTSGQVLGSLLWQELNYREKGEKVYTIDELLTDLENDILGELKSYSSITAYRRNLQKYYIERLVGITQLKLEDVAGDLYLPFFGTYSDASSIVKLHIATLLKEMQHSFPHYTNRMEKAHLSDMIMRLQKGLNFLVDDNTQPTSERTKFNKNAVVEPIHFTYRNYFGNCWENEIEFELDAEDNKR